MGITVTGASGGLRVGGANFRFTVVPEPAGVMFVVLGAALMATRRRRRQP